LHGPVGIADFREFSRPAKMAVDFSAAAGITWWNFYFRLYPTTIRAPQGELSRSSAASAAGQVAGGVGRPAGASGATGARIHPCAAGPTRDEWLPGYAPELNPVEYIWGYWKHHELPNFCPRDFTQLSHHARPLRQGGSISAAHPLDTTK
jgi:hypothetical protein